MNRRSHPDIASSLSYAEGLCADRGVKFTEKRKQVLTGLLESKKALSAYELKPNDHSLTRVSSLASLLI